MKKQLLTLVFLLSVIFSNSQVTNFNQWNTYGNSINTNTNFIGTKTNRSLIFKTNNVQRLKIDSLGQISVNGSVNLGANTFSVGARGTFSNVLVNSTATVTGQLNLSGGLVGLGNCNFASNTAFFSQVQGNSFLPLSSTNLQILTRSGNLNDIIFLTTGTTPTETMRLTSAGKMVLANTTTLSGGNSGTVAVLSDAVMSVYFQHTATSTINDGATAYISNMPISLLTSATGGTVLIPYNSKIIGYTYNSYIAGVASSAETATLSVRVNNTTDYTLTSALTYTSVENGYNNSALNIDINAGDRVAIKIVAPTWATNPTNVYGGLILLIARR